ncbi:MAG: nitrate reductase subunit beta [Thermoprotei archaeon]
MKIRGQICMVMNLDKCIGCHTCSVTCKNTWTNRKGAEYMWFNNVETKPGVGYPKRWEDQVNYRGGWELRKGKLRLRQGGRLRRLLNIFFNPVLPTIDDYYEPWSYNYDTLINRKQGVNQPVAKPVSLITGEDTQLKWGPNWEDDLAGSHVTAPQDPNWKGLEEKVKLEYENAFMFYLPRICEHCLNPSCVASCPAGAIYKRVEDGIVLVDQEACRGWRFCISGCPYKKIYFNWHTHKAEKCTFCYPRIEAGMPTVCSETCVGRIRYIGMVLYDADRVLEAASAKSEEKLYESQLSIFLDPNDPKVAERALDDGIPREVVEAAKRSPVYKMMVEWRIALPLHPEFRTLPMVWYIPPLSPILDAAASQGGGDAVDVFPLIDQMRIPIKYLANLLAAGDEEVVRRVLKKLAALRSYMRAVTLGEAADEEQIRSVGLNVGQIEEMYRLLAIGKYEERFVIPTTHREEALDLYNDQGLAGLPFYEKEMYARHLAARRAKSREGGAGDRAGDGV